MDLVQLRECFSRSTINLCLDDDVGVENGERTYLIGGEEVSGYLSIHLAPVDLESGAFVAKVVESLEARLDTFVVELDVEDVKSRCSSDSRSEKCSNHELVHMRSVDSLSCSPMLLASDELLEKGSNSNALSRNPSKDYFKAVADSYSSEKFSRKVLSSSLVDGVIKIPVQFTVESDVTFTRATAILSFVILWKAPHQLGLQALAKGQSMGARLLRNMIWNGAGALANVGGLNV